MLGSCSAKKKLLPLGLLASLFLTGCEVFKDAHQSTFDAKGPVALEQLNLFMLSFWVITIIFILVGSALLYAAIRFRWKPGMREEDIPTQTHGNPLIEIGLIIASVVALVILAVPTVKVAAFSYQIPASEEENVLEITATAYQWWWNFEYNDLGVVTSNEMVIPTDRFVRIHVRSADVVHSFWVPKLGGKRDMIPNRSNFLWLKADEVGEYHGQCAEFCGTSHANMLFRTHAVSQEDFDSWVEMKLRPSTQPTEQQQLALEGRNLFQTKGCVTCHSIDGAGGALGPNLSHLGTRKTIAAALLPNDDENLARWIRDPERVKPGNLMTKAVMEQNLQEEEIQRLVAYLRSLK